MKDFLRKVSDPEIDKKRINTRDNFELVCIRQKYFRRSANPSRKRLEQFEDMIKNISNKFYFKNINVFKTTGLEVEDLFSISRVHAVSFISMSGLKENPDLMEKFIKRHKEKYGQESFPSEKDIKLKEFFDFGKFLNQRLAEVVRVCNQKNINIAVVKHDDLYLISDNVIKNIDVLLQNVDKYCEENNCKKITKNDFKNLQKENNCNNKQNFMTKDNKNVLHIKKYSDSLSYEDIQYTEIDPTKGFFYMNPEEILTIKEMNIKKRSRKNVRRK